MELYGLFFFRLGTFYHFDYLNSKLPMPDITIYSSMLCGFCHRAKQLLNQKKLAFDEIDVGQRPEAYQEMLKISNGSSSVPQIFIGNRHVGGCDELFAMDSSGELDRLLAEQGLAL